MPLQKLQLFLAKFVIDHCKNVFAFEIRVLFVCMDTSYLYFVWKQSKHYLS